MFVYRLLVDPDTQQPLSIDAKSNRINGLEEQKMSGFLTEGIPVILPTTIKKELLSSEVHKEDESTFNYLEHYQKDAETFDYFEEIKNPISLDEINRLNQKIMKQIPSNADVILDVGCGGGWLAAKYQNDDNHIISMDISETNPKKSLARQSHDNHSALVADVFHLPIIENSVDCIIASEIMEHVSDPKLFVSSLLKVLKPGGKLIITTPYNETIPKHLCIHCNHLTPENAHLHSFNESNIGKLIPSGVQSWAHSKFGNKYFARLKLYLLIKKWPLSIWESIDKIANKIIKKPMRLMIEIVK